MNTIRQTLALAATVIRAFYRDPAAVLAMVGHHWFGSRERAAELAEQVTKTGKRRADTQPEPDD